MKRLIPFLVLALGAAFVVSTLFPRKSQSEFNLADFGRLPVLLNGRIKPMDTVARTTLLRLQGRQTVKTPGGKRIEPIAWLLTLFFDSAKADQVRTFEIVHPDVLALLHLTAEDGDGKKRFSFNQLSPSLAELERQARLADAVDAPARSTFQKAVLQLYFNLITYQQLKYSLILPESPDFLAELTRVQPALVKGIEAARARQAGQPHDEEALKAVLEQRTRFEVLAQQGSLLAIPPATGDKPEDWKKTGQALLATFETGTVDPAALTYAGLGYTWRKHQPEQFNEIVRLYRGELMKRFETPLVKSDIEARFNAAQPFYWSTVLYVIAFLFGVFSWLKWPDVLGRSGFYLLLLAWVLTTAGILTRMWLENRPPVTNLYSSALFVGWCAVTLCIVLELIYKNAIGTVAAGLIGFCTLLIAHHLSLSGDTLEMMRAVLDSNFWLATHVVTITVGYGATFLAGFLAIIYIFRGVFTRTLDKASADSLQRMVYGIVCFATLFSLVGTVLGGIWADQSWGRFWGWDPKENGALIIVLWNAILLHCRWGGLVKARGLMALAVFGNVVTAWSWFGVNMLGVGLHSYGFMDAAFWWLLGFVATQLVIIAISARSPENWKSFRGAAV